MQQPLCHSINLWRWQNMPLKWVLMRFWLRAGLIWAFHTSIVLGQEVPKDSLNVGQAEIRQNWQDLRDRSIEAESNFKRTHFLTSIAESYFADPSSDWKQHADDISVAYDGLQKSFHDYLFAPAIWVKALFNFAKVVASRPFDSAATLFDLSRALMTPIAFAFLFVLFAHLWTWAPAISKDLQRLWNSPQAVRLFLIFTLILAFFLNAFLFYLLAVSAFSLAYSRRIAFPAFAFAVAALGWIGAPLETSILKTADQLSALEALHLGRTRIEYSEASLQTLSEIERAYWSDDNGDRQSARFWIEKAPLGLDRDLYLALQVTRDGGAARGLVEMQKLRERYGPDPYVLFNLAHLNVQTQNLVASDKARDEIPPAMLETLNRASMQRSNPLMPKPPRQPSEIALRTLVSNLVGDFQPAGLRLLFYFGLPILFAAFALWWRPKASGVCSHTGEATPHVIAEESPLYLSSRIKGQKNTALQRSQIELIIRTFHRQQRKLALRWSWLVPGLRHSVIEHRPEVTFTIVAAFYVSLFLSLPTSTHAYLARLWNAFESIRFHSYGVFAFGLGCSLVIYLLGLYDSYRRGAS